MTMRPARLSLCSLMGVVFACGGTAHQAASTAKSEPACAGAQAVELSNSKRAGDVFARLERSSSATLRFACPSDAPCSLPRDQRVELQAHFRERVACEFASCRAPYGFASLPFESGSDDPCPAVLWSLASIELKTDQGTIDLVGKQAAAEVNVLARATGEGYLRFMVESPASAAGWGASSEPRAVLLDVQLELTRESLRGQMSALAAPLPAEPASELRFTSLWTATWESPARLSAREVQNR
jgi:hypothetical protein